MRVIPFPGAVPSLTFTPRGTCLVRASHYHLYFWNLTTDTLVGTHDMDYERSFTTPLSCAPNRPWLLLDHYLLELNEEESNITHCPFGAEDARSTLVLTPDGQRLVALGARALDVWDLRNWRRIRRSPGLAAIGNPSGFVPATRLGEVGCPSLALAPAPESSTHLLAITIHGSNEVLLWNVEQGQLVGRLIHPFQVHRVAFAPDGLLLATTSTVDATVRVWDVSRQQCLVAFEPFRKWSYALAFSPDGQLLAAASDDGTVRLWHCASFRELARLDWQLGALRALTFAPDGMTAAIAGRDGVVVWDVDEG